MADQLWQVKQEICDIGKRIWQRGYCAGNEGNHSVRISEDRVACTPTGISKGFLRPDMICITDMDGNQVDGNKKYKRTSEVKVHLAIYKQRPDIKAVVHSHPPHATAFALVGMPIPEGVHPEAEVFLGRIPMAPYATPSTHDLPNSILPLIDDLTNTVMMGNHGSVSFASTLQQAYYNLEILDAYCRILILTRDLGPVNVLKPDQMTELLEVKEKFGFPDKRLSCAPTGCVGDVNEPFLAEFNEVRPEGATCSCNGGSVQHSTGGITAEQLESVVQAVTDQIIANGKN